MVAADLTGDLAVGLTLGFLLGLLVGPAIRSWLIWREWTSASRDADALRAAQEPTYVGGWPPLGNLGLDAAAHRSRHGDAS